MRPAKHSAPDLATDGVTSTTTPHNMGASLSGVVLALWVWALCLEVSDCIINPLILPVSSLLAVFLTTAMHLTGGLSHTSNLYGWSVQNVISYELVLANGTIIKASATEHPDLFFAIKVGQNNFGQ